MSDPWAWTGTFGRTDQKLGPWAIYCSQRCADADGAES